MGEQVKSRWQDGVGWGEGGRREQVKSRWQDDAAWGKVAAGSMEQEGA